MSALNCINSTNPFKETFVLANWILFIKRLPAGCKFFILDVFVVLIFGELVLQDWQCFKEIHVGNRRSKLWSVLWVRVGLDWGRIELLIDCSLGGE
jgi:hypothetical protein